MAKINVYGTESYSTFICREPIEIDTDNYPELKGMTEDEMKEYIRSNAWEMTTSDGDTEIYSSLGEELMDMGVSHDKIYDEESGIIFEGE
jgi:hypothetical protein